MKNLEEFDFKEKIVLLRCDFNVSFSETEGIADTYRIEATMPTINYLLKENAKVVLISHFKEDDTGKKILAIRSKLEEFLGKKIFFVDNWKTAKNQKKIKESPFGEVFLLDNIRKDEREEKNDRSFAEDLASLGDVYVNDAFSVCHRNHASVVGLPLFLPSYAGIQLSKEVKILSKAISDPWKPLVVIVGGAKVSSKIKVLNHFLTVADHLILGGKIANEILMIKGIITRRSSLPEETIEKINQIELTSSKMHLPVDVVASPNSKAEFYVRTTGPGSIRNDEDVFDIGPETIKIYSEIIENAKMIVWGGPLGLFEEKKFEKGTREIARAVFMNHKAFKIIGGGDTGVALKKFGFRKGIDHISTGGGAMLDFMTGKELPGLKALNHYEN